MRTVSSEELGRICVVAHGEEISSRKNYTRLTDIKNDGLTKKACDVKREKSRWKG